MNSVLITGASGNVGKEVVNGLNKLKHSLKIFLGVKTLSDLRTKSSTKIESVRFDFNDVKSYEPAISGCDILFLLRPPQISNVAKYFKPIIETCQRTAVKHIIFLSVQGVEKSKIIPHHKIEKLIVESNIPYTFLRPAYFMQNFTTILRRDLISNKRIYLPAGDAKFALIDVRDVGNLAALVLTDVTAYVNQSYELMSNEKFTFSEMAEMISSKLGFKVSYISPSLLNFFLTKRKEKMPAIQILVMMMLHYLPRFQNEPEINDCMKRLTGHEPITFQQFIDDNRGLLTESVYK